MTYRGDKINTSSLVAACIRICDQSLRQNLHQPMREGQLFSSLVKFELVHISPLPNSPACTEQVSCRSSSANEVTCRRDESQRFVASCVSTLKSLPQSVKYCHIDLYCQLSATDKLQSAELKRNITNRKRSIKQLCNFSHFQGRSRDPEF